MPLIPRAGMSQRRWGAAVRGVAVTPPKFADLPAALTQLCAGCLHRNLATLSPHLPTCHHARST